MESFLKSLGQGFPILDFLSLKVDIFGDSLSSMNFSFGILLIYKPKLTILWIAIL